MLTLNLLREVDRWQDDVARLFQRGELSAAPQAPALNIWTKDNSVVVTVELPGVDAGALEIAVEDQTLTLRGSRPPAELKDGERWLRRERSSGAFERSVELPFHVEADAVEARFQNGVLSVTLPRAKAELPRRIPVKVA
jgi:HSP20 family protein